MLWPGFSRSGAAVANKATARKIAVYYYHLMTKGFDFVDEGLKKYEERCNTQRIKSLEKKAKELAELFIKNFAQYTDNKEGKDLVAAGPKL